MAKGIMIIDGIRVPFDGEKNVLAVVRKAGIDIPTFCYYSDLSIYDGFSGQVSVCGRRYSHWTDRISDSSGIA